MVQVRRVVTSHDASGRAIVSIDEVVSGAERRPNTSMAMVWTTDSFPVDNTTPDDGAKRDGVATTLAGGTVFRIVEFGPGNAPRMHRTDSIDYAVIMSGEIDMQLDDSVVHLKAGDVVVQRGTIHNWVNTGSVPCAIAFVLIDAKPVSAGGKVLEAQG